MYVPLGAIIVDYEHTFDTSVDIRRNVFGFCYGRGGVERFFDQGVHFVFKSHVLCVSYSTFDKSLILTASYIAITHPKHRCS